MLFPDKTIVGKPEPIKFQLTPRGKYRLRLPYKDGEFLREFKNKVAPACRFFRTDIEAWEISPLPEAGLGYLNYVADIVERHFSRPVRIIHMTPEEEARMMAEIEAESAEASTAAA